MAETFPFWTAVVFCIIVTYCNAATYENPLIPNTDLPDPGAIFLSDGAYFVANTATGSDERKFPVHMSKDLVTWELYSYIFDNDTIPSWAIENSSFWAPEIHIIGGTYTCLFAARTEQNMLSVGAATSHSILGPWKDIGAPLVTTTRVGNIDPHFFRDNTTDTQYLVWKEDGNDPAHWEPETPIWGQAISDDLKLSGDRHLLLENDNTTWEGDLVEAPWIEKIGLYYYLFYSANDYASTKYAIGVARSNSSMGPYTKMPTNPLLFSNSAWSGPGHCSVMAAKNNPHGPYFLIYHAWVVDHIGSTWPRVLMMDSFVIDSDGWPKMSDPSAPTHTAQPVPE